MINKFDFRYFLLQSWVNIIFRLHFKKLVFIGKENIPKDKPVVFAPTHRNALVDALILVYENRKKQVVFLARADIFKKKLIAKILHFFRIMPIYRLRDGQENLSKNEDIFEKCGQILKKNNPICLFPEAKHNPNQSLLPLQKAVPRIALPTEEKSNFTLDTHVVPISFYYTDKDSILSDLYVTYAPPIKVCDYEELYKQDPKIAINKMRQDMDVRLRQYVVDIPDENYDVYADLIAINAAHYPVFGIIEGAKAIIKYLKELKSEFPDGYKKKVDSVRNAVEKLKQNNLLPSDPLLNRKTLGKIILQSSILLIGFPFAVVGFLNTIFPILIHRKLQSLFQDKQFISSVRIVVGIFVVPLFFLMQAVVLWIGYSSFWIAIAYFFISFLLVVIWFYWRLGFRKMKRELKIYQFAKFNPTEWKSILNELNFFEKDVR